jgi:hypothetical protein
MLLVKGKNCHDSPAAEKIFFENIFQKTLDIILY